MRDDETGTTGGTTTPPDSSPAVAAAHVVSEHDVRLALTALELEDRALTVHRATAFLTALGVTVTHAPLPATPWSADPAATTPATTTPAEAHGPAVDLGDGNLARSERASGPVSRVTVRIPAGESDDDSVEGDIANLLEVLSHLQDRLPTPTPEELRSRPRVALPHAQPARPTVRASVRRRSIA
ncbi:hypothetical protein GXP71_17635 [Cellulomonas sp. H30R-01]|uniref:hypothetical protein n=1 Tax=Cellulomonas sp. H30R-01 TaxID=2704467 RepID=UPI00138C1331|nr:hypothetical protein [Cellulomonas sp. H30R-01]QHT57716.1 hypothetical protein GXP71_17635 [Cellulomonas sp. H30R-01]